MNTSTLQTPAPTCRSNIPKNMHNLSSTIREASARYSGGRGQRGRAKGQARLQLWDPDQVHPGQASTSSTSTMSISNTPKPPSGKQSKIIKLTPNITSRTSNQTSNYLQLDKPLHIQSPPWILVPCLQGHLHFQTKVMVSRDTWNCQPHIHMWTVPKLIQNRSYTQENRYNSFKSGKHICPCMIPPETDPTHQ